MIRLGFLGVGWIGQHRMRALLESGIGQVAAIADADPAAVAAAGALARGAEQRTTLDELLALELDGIVIATPSALHAQQAQAALSAGCAVFCQKPLARTAADTRAVVELARARNRLLHVDFSYRYTTALQALKRELPELGHIYAARATFHNAYGPDKPWYYDRSASGGGCVTDLGVHLVDALLWLLEGARVDKVESALFAGGERLLADSAQVEDFASVRMQLGTGAIAELACSWRLPVGRDAQIELELFGASGGLRMRNLNGSFYDFVAERMRGTSTEVLAQPPDAWGGRAIVAWARRLSESAAFDPAAQRYVEVSEILERVYGDPNSGLQKGERT